MSTKNGSPELLFLKVWQNIYPDLRPTERTKCDESFKNNLKSIIWPESKEYLEAKK